MLMHRGLFNDSSQHQSPAPGLPPGPVAPVAATPGSNGGSIFGASSSPSMNGGLYGSHLSSVAAVAATAASEHHSRSVH